MRPPAARPDGIRPPAATFLDACCVLAFVAIGRASHHDGESVSGLAAAAWPFLAGLAVGWLVTRAWRRPAAIVPGGVGAWLGAVAIGMILRVVAGQGTTLAFISVALAFLGLFLLGWRTAATAWSRHGRSAADPGAPAAPHRG
jgi:FtsH-binding integral membrane protein